MNTIKIHEQIALLRKAKGLTQEELANMLGVTNQAVSKWESAQCCPDIQLLPAIAELFAVSVDELLGYESASVTKDILPALRRKLDSLPKGDDYDFIFRMAAALHVIIFSKDSMADPNSGWDIDDAIEHAGNTEWGYSCINIPKLTTTMRQGSVFFSNNKNLHITNVDIRHITSVLKSFGDVANLKIAAALYQLTVSSEEIYVTAEQISEKSGLSKETVSDCLTGSLSPFILENTDMEEGFRLAGRYMHILPILSLLSHL